MLFHYKKTRKQQAFTIGVYIVLMPMLFYLFTFVGKDKANFDEIYAIVGKLALAVGLMLLAIMLWFLRSKELFELYVTQDEFYSHHPLFKVWSFSVNPKDISRISHNYYSGSRTTKVDMLMNDGTHLQLCNNYGYSKKALYEALRIANPAIALPDNTSVFKSRWRKRNKK